MNKKKILNISEDIIPYIGVILFSVSLCWMVVEALSRQIFSYSFSLSQEVVIFCMVWSVFISLSDAGKKGYHISVDLLILKLPVKVRRIVNIFTALLSIFYCVFVLVSSVKFISHLYSMGIVSESSLQLPMWVVLLCVPIGMILLILFYLERSIYYINQNDHNPKQN